MPLQWAQNIAPLYKKLSRIQPMSTIVSITPIQVTADSRTFKIASSFARFGYRSIVIEGEMSKELPTGLLFELVGGSDSIPVRHGAVSTGVKIRENDKRLKERLRKWIKRRPMLIQKILRALLGPPHYFKNYVLRPIKEMPAGSLYYLHAPYQFPAVYWWSRRGAVPIIYDSHDFYPVVSPNPYYKRLEALCVKKAAAVVTVSEGVARLMRQEFACQPIVVRNCEDTRLNRKPEMGLREKLGLDDDIFLIVSVGQAKSGQAVDEAFWALRDLPPSIHLAFVGKNTENYTDAVNCLGLQSRVHFVPPVSPDEVVPFINSADASIILYFAKDVNYEDSLPNKFFQAVTAELPLLYPKLPEMRRLAEQYGLGFPIDAKSPDSIRAGIERLVKERSNIGRLKENLRAASQALSWEQEEVILYKLVKGVIGGSTRAVG
jgi:glycosyltransferase involved in cell wall biosynthesis